MAKFFIGGIAPTTTEDDMRSHFEQFGELVDVAVMRDQFGIPRCFGFVQYADPSTHTCNPMDDHIVSGKKVDVKPAVPKEGGFEQTGAIRTKKIFVGGLSKTSTADTIKAHFYQFGTVVEVIMKYDEAGVSRGFCFVEFDNEDSAELACQSTPMLLDDKEVECKLARPMGEKGGKGFGKGKGGKAGLYGGYLPVAYAPFPGYGRATGFAGRGGPMRQEYFAPRAAPYAPPIRGAYGSRPAYISSRYASPAPAAYTRGAFSARGAPPPAYGYGYAQAY